MIIKLAYDGTGVDYPGVRATPSMSSRTRLIYSVRRCRKMRHLFPLYWYDTADISLWPDETPTVVKTVFMLSVN